jgi:hypothetical protein
VRFLVSLQRLCAVQTRLSLVDQPVFHSSSLASSPPSVLVIVCDGVYSC